MREREHRKVHKEGVHRGTVRTDGKEMAVLQQEAS